MLVHNQIQKRTNVVKCYAGSDRYQLIDDAAISVQKARIFDSFSPTTCYSTLFYFYAR